MDLFNIESNERLDRGDLSFALNSVPTGLVNELTGSFLVTAGSNAIISGFRPSGTGLQPVQIGDSGVPNTALLGQRVNGAITQGVFSAVGPSTLSLSAANLPANTYGIFVRFRRVPGKTETRKFVDKSVPGTEYAQLSDTRLVASWEGRLEVTAPSAEWLKIGSVVVTSPGSGQGNTIVVTDQRTLFFEGSAASGFVPTWGSSSDRSSDRGAANSATLQRQLDALRQCLIDIKGRGLATWYQPNISGMQIGTGFGLADSPTANQLNLGDSGFYLLFKPPTQALPAGQPVVAFNAASDYLTIDRIYGELARYVGGTKNLSLFGGGGGAQIGAGSIVSGTTVTVNQQQSSTGYGLAVQSTNTSTASIGILSTSSNKGLLDFGPSPGNSLGYMQVDWTSGLPVMQFGVNLFRFLSVLSPGSSGTPVLNFSSTSFNISASTGLYLNNRKIAPSTIVWGAGVYSGNNVISCTGAPGLTATASFSADSGGHNSILITFNQSLPSTPIINVSGQYNETGSRAGKVYQTSWIIKNGTQIRVACANGANDPEDNAFSFLILYGS